METPSDLEYRKELARFLLSDKVTDVDQEMEPDLATLSAVPGLAAAISLPYPDGLAPIPEPRLNPVPDPDAPLPTADVLVITWTVDELNALCDILTPDVTRNAWYRYRHKFDSDFREKIRPGAPSLVANRLGSWYPTRIGNKSVLCFKSELHLNQDGVTTGPGLATLPVKDLFLQLIDEVKPSVVITVGTAGSVHKDFELGDVVVTRGAKFRLQSEFGQELFANASYRSEWAIPTTYFDKATELMQISAPHLKEPEDIRPTIRYPEIDAPTNTPDIKLDGRDMPDFHPMLSTDFFEFGTSKNNLFTEGSGMEMGDAALGLACSRLVNPPRWVVVRNLSDPQINGDLPSGPGRELNLQTVWAVYYYRKYGYWTSVNSALTTWAIIAGL